ncbi:MAG: lipid-A-disaccharide synthase [Candidatus Obscuribacterales bacterium]|jgi:lipid-A-disaccharide synthase|nr:lipid-A-disaccharide synthase [Candidatus Obscuribacterales bacterium]
MNASPGSTPGAEASSKRKSLFISVGDPSADRHAAKLIKRLKERAPELDIWGMGGVAMEEQGARLLHNRAALAIVGIFEVIRDIPQLKKVRDDLLKNIVEQKPDAVLLMDYGGFNLGFATLVRKTVDTPIIYFISPQVWGSRPWRINAVKDAVSKILVIFPFEEALYRSKGVNSRFVGHPLTLRFNAEQVFSTKEEFCAKHNLDPDRPIIGVFPGSRRGEIRSHSEAVLHAINWLRQERPEIQFVVAMTNDVVRQVFNEEIDRLGFSILMGSTIKTISSEENDDLMKHSTLLWTKSGTTTLEAALLGKPMLVFYRGFFISYLVLLCFKIVKYVGWPNLLNGEELVPELIQLDCRAEQLVRYTRDWLDVPGLLAETTDGLRIVRSHLGEGDFTDNAAEEVLTILGLN